MSSPTEDLHLRIGSLGAERTLQLLDQEQTRRARIEHENELGLFYQPHRLRVSDSWDMDVGVVTNHPPRFNTITIPDLVNNQQRQDFDLSATDPDTSDLHTFSFTSRPGTWVSLAGTRNHTLRINPNGRAPGTYNISLRVVDNGSPQGSDTTTVSFRILQANRAPEFTSSVPAQTVREETLLSFSVSARDDDGDDITYRIKTGKKTGMDLHSTSGVFEWTPAMGQTGGTITIEADDGRGGTDTTDVSITVTTPDPPAATTTTLTNIAPKSRTGTPGRVSFSVYARNSDDLDITFSDGSNAGTFSGRTKLQDGRWTARWTSPNYTTTGAKYVTITATASDGRADQQTVAITVNAHPRPVLDRIGNKTVRKTETLTFTARATNTTSYSLSSDDGVPSGALDSSTGEFSWTPGSGVTAEDKEAIITATGPGGTASETITITVQAAPTQTITATVSISPDVSNHYVPYNSTRRVVVTMTSVSSTGDGNDIRNAINNAGAFSGAATVSGAKRISRAILHIPTTATTWTTNFWATLPNNTRISEITTISVTREAPDYRPNITISRPLAGVSYRRLVINSFNNITPRPQLTSTFVNISATRYNGETIPLSDLTVTQTGQPDTWHPTPLPDTTCSNKTLCQAAETYYFMRASVAAKTTIKVSYTDTVNNRSYTTTKSVTFTVI